ncbi:hypothetical protein MHEL_02320 [Mycolicibacterium helvum]|uniref:Uncharacterized protein n=1 Tax=Mycolicibacterium helvum TaxID=1534349 RepID=A0A7I7T0K4_9MYCO|nr:hypothetical protein MHEL_02320 [Mycolicibacterium helvum]
MLQADTDLERVDVDATAPDGEYIEGWVSSHVSSLQGSMGTCYDCAPATAVCQYFVLTFYLLHSRC